MTAQPLTKPRKRNPAVDVLTGQIGETDDGQGNRIPITRQVSTENGQTQTSYNTPGKGTAVFQGAPRGGGGFRGATTDAAARQALVSNLNLQDESQLERNKSGQIMNRANIYNAAAEKLAGENRQREQDFTRQRLIDILTAAPPKPGEAPQLGDDGNQRTFRTESDNFQNQERNRLLADQGRRRSAADLLTQFTRADVNAESTQAQREIAAGRNATQSGIAAERENRADRRSALDREQRGELALLNYDAKLLGIEGQKTKAENQQTVYDKAFVDAYKAAQESALPGQEVDAVAEAYRALSGFLGQRGEFRSPSGQVGTMAQMAEAVQVQAQKRNVNPLQIILEMQQRGTIGDFNRLKAYMGLIGQGAQ